MAKMRADGCLEVAALSRTVSGSMRLDGPRLGVGRMLGKPDSGRSARYGVPDSGTFTEGSVPPRRQTMM